MVLGTFILIFIGPSAVVGFWLVSRTKPVVSFISMMAVFAMTVFAAWFSFSPLFTTMEGISILVVQCAIALFIAGMKVPAVSRLVKSYTL